MLKVTGFYFNPLYIRFMSDIWVGTIGSNVRHMITMNVQGSEFKLKFLDSDQAKAVQELLCLAACNCDPEFLDKIQANLDDLLKGF